MSLKLKRTVAEEKRVINSKWELDYFMVETATHTMMCLKCRQILKTVKGDNAKQHFHCRHWKASLGRSTKVAGVINTFYYKVLV